MIYLNNDRTEFIESYVFNMCGNEAREELNREYHAPTAQELYDFIDWQPTWDSVPADAYDQLADLCGVDIKQADGPDTLMDRCAAALAAQYVQDEDGRTVDYAAAVELMDDDLRERDLDAFFGEKHADVPSQRVLRDEGEAAAFAWVRKNLLGKS